MSKEKINFDEYVVAPGETILELLETTCMTQIDLSNKTGINKKTINEIIKGKAPITVSTAMKLEYVFDLPASFWNNLESNYRTSLEREKDMESIVQEERFLDFIPYNEMAKRNWDWIEVTRNPKEKVINLRKFFGVASLSFDTELKKKLIFRKSAGDNFSLEALYCWLRYGEIKASDILCADFSIDILKRKINDIRSLATRPFLECLDEIKNHLSSCGVALVYEPHLPHTYINGVSYKVTCDKAIIMISDRGKRDDILWFTLFHEIAHLLKHSKKDIFIDQDGDSKNEIEREADDYSKNILIKNSIYNEFIRENDVYTERKIISFAAKNNISTSVVVGRLQKDGLIKWNEFNSLITRI